MYWDEMEESEAGPGDKRAWQSIYSRKNDPDMSISHSNVPVY